MARPRQARRSAGGGRFYEWSGGERYWSVTTILDVMPKDGLKWWAAKSVAEFAFDDASTWLSMPRGRAVDYLKREPFRWTGERADVGTAVHEAAESYALKKPMGTLESREERAYVAAFLDWTKTMAPRFVATEASVYNRTQKYAGTLDAIVELALDLLPSAMIPADWMRDSFEREGRLWVRLLIDYKTGGDVAEAKGVYPEAALQLNAYGKAEFIGLPDKSEAPLPELGGAAVLQLGPQGWRLVPVELSDRVFKSFLYAREVFRFVTKIGPEALGDPIEHILDTNPLTED